MYVLPQSGLEHKSVHLGCMFIKGFSQFIYDFVDQESVRMGQLPKPFHLQLHIPVHVIGSQGFIKNMHEFQGSMPKCYCQRAHSSVLG